MQNKLKQFTNKHKKILMFVPFYILYLLFVELILGIGFGNNNAWNKGENWSKSNSR